MDKLKYIKLENEDGSYSNSIPLAVDSDHVDVNGNTLTNELSYKANNSSINNLQNQINSLASGSPKGVYTDAEALKAANPDTGVYITTNNGHIYSWIKNSTSNPVDLGVYQETGIGEDEVTFDKLHYNANYKFDYDKTALAMGYKKFYHSELSWEKGAINNSNGTDSLSDNCLRTPASKKFLYNSSDPVIILNSNNLFRVKIYKYNTEGTFISVSSTWITDSKYVLPNDLNGYYLRIVILKFGTSNIADIKEIFDYIKIIKANDITDNLASLKKAKNGSTINYFKTAMSKGFAKFLNLKWENGAINNNSGLDVVSINCERTIDYLTYDLINPITVLNEDTTTYKWRIYVYDTNNNFVRVDSWISDSSYEIPLSYSGYKLRFACVNQLSTEQVDSNDLHDKVNWFYSNDKIDNFETLRYLIDTHSNNLYGKKLLAIGDSFVKGHTESTSWPEMIGGRNNMTVYNKGVNGACLAHRDDLTITSIVDDIDNIIASVPSTDYIVLYCGHNDSSKNITIGTDSDDAGTTFKGAYNIVINKLLNNYPTAKIILFTPANRKNIEMPFVNATIDIAHKYSLPHFNNYYDLGLNFNNSNVNAIYELGDSLHFNNLGLQRVSKVYENILKGL